MPEVTETNPNTETDPNTVTLSEPVRIDGKDVTKITLRKPKSGEMRGLKVIDILQMDVNAMINLLPRVSQPPLSPQQVADLDPGDLMALSYVVLGFFATAAQLQQTMR